MTKLIQTFFIFFILNLNSRVFSQNLEDDDLNDFGIPNQTNKSPEDDECALSKDSELIKLLNFKLKNLTLHQKNLKVALL